MPFHALFARRTTYEPLRTQHCTSLHVTLPLQAFLHAFLYISSVAEDVQYKQRTGLVRFQYKWQISVPVSSLKKKGAAPEVQHSAVHLMYLQLCLSDHSPWCRQCCITRTSLTDSLIISTSPPAQINDGEIQKIKKETSLETYHCSGK